MIETLPQTHWQPQVLRDAVLPAQKAPMPAPKTVTSPISPDEALVRSMAHAYQSAIVSACDLNLLEIVAREDIIAPFFKVGDLGYIYGARGNGKSWLAQIMSTALAKGSEFATWKVNRPRRVLYVDGEMPLDALKDRQALISSDVPERLYFLNHERLFEKSEKVLNLAEPSAQDALSGIVKEQEIEVVVLDNLSCLFFGVRENEADAWEAILPWLLHLRRMHVAVIIVAHAGRNGEMRGTSRREDQAFWMLRVKAADAPAGFRGARFRTTFAKNRNAVHEDCPALEWTLRTPNGTRNPEISVVPTTNDFAVLGLIAGGMVSCGEIANELGVTAGRISQTAAMLKERDLITMAGRDYKITPAGSARLADALPRC